MQSTVNNLFRLPLNLLVALGTMLSDWFPPEVVFGICACAHLLAVLCQSRLALRTRGVAGAVKARTD